jgi:ATP-dependent DNA helicase RecQ
MATILVGFGAFGHPSIISRCTHPVDHGAAGSYTPAVISESELRAALRRYWGYESFRPRQEHIVRSLLEGRNVCVVMPTGGGKSLCYELPAVLLSGKTAVVISPLIALMQDQVTQLAQMGIPAALLNSSLSAAEQAEITRAACAGKYRLLYISPERLARADTTTWLQRVPVSFFVVDEAHCISEWGHEFRPDYRRLSRLRAEFPDRPVAAFTASATRHVRHDIIEQLHLDNPDKYIASFHRPNLRYIVRECDSFEQMDLLVALLRKHPGHNVIVYSPTIKRVSETAAYLAASGIPAVEYHGQMDAVTRRRNQERWMSDQVRVLVGTLAFGLGINKASVRAVVHLSLPKSIEQYYQEAGRAGRDGQPADCILLWQKQDVGLLAHFIREIEDPLEQGRAWRRYDAIRRFVDCKLCRHRQICMHFGESPKWTSCRACDVCGCDADWVCRWRPSPTYPRGKRGKRKALGPRESVPTVLATGSAPETPIPGSSMSTSPSGIDADLREYLREWRLAAAKARSLPAFVVLHDSALDDLCRRQPRTLSEMRRVHGFGEYKTKTYGEEILGKLRQYRERQSAAGAGSRVDEPSRIRSTSDR